MELKKIFKTKYSQELINEKRSMVRYQFLKNSNHLKDHNIVNLTGEDLHKLVVLYDQVFFQNILSANESIVYTYHLPKDMNQVGGLTKINMKQIKKPHKKPVKIIQSIEISINVGIVFDFKFAGEDRYSCGILVKNSLDVLMVILEHELCHVLEFQMYNKSDDYGRVFKQLTKGVFGHTSVTHGLMTSQEKHLRLYKIMVGDEVKLIVNGRASSGIVQKVDKVYAIVLVYDSNGKFVMSSNGQRCNKYKVSKSSLIKVSKGKREQINFRL